MLIWLLIYVILVCWCDEGVGFETGRCVLRLPSESVYVKLCSDWYEDVSARRDSCGGCSLRVGFNEYVGAAERFAGVPLPVDLRSSLEEHVHGVGRLAETGGLTGLELLSLFDFGLLAPYRLRERLGGVSHENTGEVAGYSRALADVAIKVISSSPAKLQLGQALLHRNTTLRAPSILLTGDSEDLLPICIDVMNIRPRAMVKLRKFLTHAKSTLSTSYTPTLSEPRDSIITDSITNHLSNTNTMNNKPLLYNNYDNSRNANIINNTNICHTDIHTSNNLSTNNLSTKKNVLKNVSTSNLCTKKNVLENLSTNNSSTKRYVLENLIPKNLSTKMERENEYNINEGKESGSEIDGNKKAVEELIETWPMEGRGVLHRIWEYFSTYSVENYMDDDWSSNRIRLRALLSAVPEAVRIRRGVHFELTGVNTLDGIFREGLLEDNEGCELGEGIFNASCRSCAFTMGEIALKNDVYYVKELDRKTYSTMLDTQTEYLMRNFSRRERENICELGMSRLSQVDGGLRECGELGRYICISILLDELYEKDVEEVLPNSGEKGKLKQESYESLVRAVKEVKRRNVNKEAIEIGPIEQLLSKDLKNQLP